MSKFADLVVCVRCHKEPTLILDTLDSIQWSVNPRCTRVMLAVDGIPRLARKLKKRSKVPVHCSETRWGWGAGLWTLLLESMEFAASLGPFGHFMSVDYDTLFLGKGADTDLLSLITSDRVGLIGSYRPDNAHWRAVYETTQDAITRAVGRSVPRAYIPGEGVQGGAMLFTRAMIDAMADRNYFTSIVRQPKLWTTIADDHLAGLFCRLCNLQIHDAGMTVLATWKATRDPRGLERRGVKVFHPIKITPKGCHHGTEMELRNYFRVHRGRRPIK